MLKHLTIKNYALIKHLEMQPSSEFNIITGETGAGKSIMLGAIGLLLGNRADTKALYDKSQKCVIEGNFDVKGYPVKEIFEEEKLDYENETIIRREINQNGKSRAFINDTPVMLETLKKVGDQLIDIHSQHETILLGSSNFQLKVVDSVARNQELLNNYKEIFTQHKTLETAYNELVNNAANAKKELDYHSFLLNELNDAHLEPGEQETLQEELKLLENAEEIKSKLNLLLDQLSNSEQAVTGTLHHAVNELEKLCSFSDKYENLKKRTESCFIEIKDIVDEIEKQDSTIDFDQGKTEQVQERLSLLYNLQQKHQVNSVKDLLNIQMETELKVNKTLNLDQEIATLKGKLEHAQSQLKKASKQLTETRAAVIPKIEEKLTQLLTDLGMPNATIRIEHNITDPGINGADNITFLFSASKGIEPKELKKVASGGEFSRLLLCTKYLIADKTALPTIIFDEIDSGISGEIAIKVGNMMQQMSQNHQLFTISHLPQIAARGTAHYFVYKDNTNEKAVSRIKKLTNDERIAEIAQMIGGEKPSSAVLQNAREMLSL